MRKPLAALGCLLVTSSVGCAAPTTDDEAAATDQASSVDEAVALIAEMQKSLTGARLEITTTMRFQNDEAWFSTGINTACRLRLLASATQVIPSVPRGDVYAIDTQGIRLARSDRFTWTIPLDNARTQAGASGSKADIVLECLEVGNRGVPTAKSIKSVINGGLLQSAGTLIAPGIP